MYAFTSTLGRGDTKIFWKLSLENSIVQYVDRPTSMALIEWRPQIHVDRYKHSILTHLHSDPFLSSITTNDDETVRFHACERFSRCPMVDLGDYDHLPENGGHRKPQTRQQRSKLGKRVVYVNPVSSMSKARWEIYQEDTRRRLAEGEEINSLVNPHVMTLSMPEWLLL